MPAPIRLGISRNRRHLITGDGAPFFWLGDTAWELLHRCTRDEITHYLRVRAAQGFNVVQAVVLAELDGLTVPNMEGHVPLHDLDPSRPDERYFALVDFAVAEAARAGITLALLPTWGDKFNRKWRGQEVFTPDNAYVYGRWLGTRYADAPLVWVLGGDRPLETATHLTIVQRMAAGLREGDGGRHLMTFHPCGVQTSAAFVHGEPWLDFNMIQSGHCGRDNGNWRMIALDRQREPTKPVLDGEPNYEDHPVMKPGWQEIGGWFDAYDVRKAAYRAVLSGACGHTYGCHDIWQMWTPERAVHNRVRTPWTEALQLPGARQMGHVRKLAESYAILWGSASPMRVQAAGVASDSLAEHGIVGHFGHACAAIHLPAPRGITVTVGDTAGPLTWQWFDPRTGEAHALVTPARPETGVTLAPPNAGPQDDWVLLIEDRVAGA